MGERTLAGPGTGSGPGVPAGAGFEADVHEQPEALARFLDAEADAADRIADRLERLDVRSVLVAGRGSSDNATRYGHYLFGAEHRLPVAQATPSLFTRYGTPPMLDGALVVAVSAGGRSHDVLAVVEEGARQRRPTVAITNDPGSPLAGAADHVLPLHAGPEQGPTASKTYTSTLAAFALLSAAMAGDTALRDELRGLPDMLARLLDQSAAACKSVAAVLADALRATVVGRGFNYGTAKELALKLTALTRTAPIAYSAADVIRGPVPSTGETPVLLIAPSGRVLSDAMGLIPTLRASGTPLLALSDVDEVLDEADRAVRLPAGVREWLSPMVSIVPAQLIALEVARFQGTLDEHDD